jgi:hypothetical protein
MTMFQRTKEGPILYRFRCGCGTVTEWRYTVEAAGRDFDLHMAEKFPIGTQRRPCEKPRTEAQ